MAPMKRTIAALGALLLFGTLLCAGPKDKTKVYDHVGRLEKASFSSDYVLSSEAGGETYTTSCDVDAHSVNCYEGGGSYKYLVLDDGRETMLLGTEKQLFPMGFDPIFDLQIHAKSIPTDGKRHEIATFNYRIAKELEYEVIICLPVDLVDKKGKTKPGEVCYNLIHPRHERKQP
jgi:hypothetical protein